MLKDFLRPYQGPFLLALSGGPDSMALYYMLKELGVEVVSAHIDHGWREESRQEAEWLASIIPGLHVKRLEKSSFNGNLEESARRLRLDFLKETARKVGAEVIVMGHHADDQAETVMKRLFEKVPPYSLKAIPAVSKADGFTILRPLLSLSKKEILDYLGTRPYLVDSTNLEGPFLRSRMRRELIPFLNETFGKNCTTAFGHFHEEIEALQAYLKRQTEGKYRKISGPFGACLFLDGDPYELKFMIHRFLKEEGEPIHYQILEKIAQNPSQARFGNLVVDRGVLFLCRALPECKGTIKLASGPNEAPPFSAHVDKGEPLTGWEAFWRGEVSTGAEGDLWLSAPDPLSLKRRQDHKIASFLRHVCPIVKNERGEVFDFLLPPKKNPKTSLRILLKFTALC